MINKKTNTLQGMSKHMKYLLVPSEKARANYNYRFTGQQQALADYDQYNTTGIDRSTINAQSASTPLPKESENIILPQNNSTNNETVLPAYAGSMADLSKGSFREKLVKNALYEYERWGKGKITESNPDMHDVMFRYWRTVSNAKTAEQFTVDLQNKPDSHHWSAAFISTMIKEAGGSNFKFNGAHSYFLTQAADNRKKDIGSYKGYKPEEVKVEVGDLVAFGRNGKPAYDARGAYDAHSDIVVAVHDGYVETIGGNLSDGVGKTIVKTDKQGKIANSKYHMVVKFNY